MSETPKAPTIDHYLSPNEQDGDFNDPRNHRLEEPVSLRESYGIVPFDEFLNKAHGEFRINSDLADHFIALNERKTITISHVPWVEP